jgi:hypothetical protein
VRDAATLEDHTGELTARLALRITDRGSATLPGGGDDPATVSDMALDVPVRCTATADEPGANCSASTTVDALIPSAVAERRRSIWALGQVEVLGPGEQPFLRQGIFIP